MIEAELKARVRAPDEVLRRLEERTPGRAEVYRDTYYEQVALDDVRAALHDLGIQDADLTTELYTDVVAAHRRA
ncbi:MAG: hypothetical protein ACRDPT_04660 [Streptomycetales bacterium]